MLSLTFARAPRIRPSTHTHTHTHTQPHTHTSRNQQWSVLLKIFWSFDLFDPIKTPVSSFIRLSHSSSVPLPFPPVSELVISCRMPSQPRKSRIRAKKTHHITNESFIYSSWHTSLTCWGVEWGEGGGTKWSGLNRDAEIGQACLLAVGIACKTIDSNAPQAKKETEWCWLNRDGRN